MDKADLVTHRTGIVTDQECGMKRWWLLEEGGAGIVPVKAPSYFQQGIDIHEDLACLARGQDLESILDDLGEIMPDPLDQVKMEVWSRRVGWITAFAKFIWPVLMADFEVVWAEKELALEYGQLWVANTADLLLRHRKEGWLLLIDYKTVGLLGKGWMAHWRYAIQVHINIRAVEHELNERVRYGQIIGLSKGREDGGKLRHPYTWAYVRNDQWSTQYHPAAELRPIWDHPAGPAGWAESLGPEVASSVFPFSAPIPLDNRLLDILLAVRLRREREVMRWRQKCQTDPIMRAMIFEPRFERCMPTMGEPCGYLEACHNAEINSDPIGSGLFVKRESHHELERMWRMMLEEEQ